MIETIELLKNTLNFIMVVLFITILYRIPGISLYIDIALPDFF